MRFKDKLKKLSHEEIWREYCGFLDLSMDQYMHIQNRLMDEQFSLWKNSGLGKALLKNRDLADTDEFRKSFPLTKYEDYADILLLKRGDMLPAEPVIWLQTTWEGGIHPVKVAPYSQGMLNTYKTNVIACMILGTSRMKGQFDVKNTDSFLYALAPLPYATGLYPRALNDEIDIQFMPSVKEAEKLSFSERNKKGFKIGMSKGIDYFFGLGSVAYFVSLALSSMTGGGSSSKKHISMSPATICRYLRARRICRREDRSIMPKDLFDLKAFMVAGTDNNCYKDDLEDLWGIRPMELFAGTEPSIIGTETWTRNGMYFFPDTCFYEFIPLDELKKESLDDTYMPKTCLMNEVVPGETYELVVSVLKGGAFMRYRVGDMYRCAGLESKQDQTSIPRFYYTDRVPDIIDIAGFTRISEKEISSALKLSGLPIRSWTAAKQFNENGKPFLHLFVEIESGALQSRVVSREIIRDQLSIYFKYVDNDYKDLKLILGMDPLEVTILKCGTFEYYQQNNPTAIRSVNPASHELRELLDGEKKCQATSY